MDILWVYLVNLEPLKIDGCISAKNTSESSKIYGLKHRTVMGISGQ
jgi:hypothetical protein